MCEVVSTAPSTSKKASHATCMFSAAASVCVITKCSAISVDTYFANPLVTVIIQSSDRFINASFFTVSDPLSMTFIQHTVFNAVLHIWRPSISSQPMDTQCSIDLLKMGSSSYYDRVGQILISNYEMYCQWWAWGGVVVKALRY